MLDKFREKVKNDGNTVDFFADLNSLKYVASQTFSNAIDYADDNAGWVRYRDLVDIINEEVGVLVEIDNVNKLAQAMEKVRENYNKYNPESLRNYCTEKFSANVIIKKIINVYKKVIR